MSKFCMRRNLKLRKEFGIESILCDVGIRTRAEGKEHNTIILVRTPENNNAKLKAHCNKSQLPKMPNRCNVGGYSNVSNTKQGISLHLIPFAGDERTEARKRRKQLVDFVRLKWAKWDPTPNSTICSTHFAKDDFTQRFFGISNQIHWLVADEIGVAAIPKYSICSEEKPLSARAKRMVSIQYLNSP